MVISLYLFLDEEKPTNKKEFKSLNHINGTKKKIQMQISFLKAIFGK
jgi:hypothetical protein